MSNGLNTNFLDLEELAKLIKAKQEELLVELDKREKGYLRRDEPYR